MTSNCENTGLGIDCICLDYLTVGEKKHFWQRTRFNNVAALKEVSFHVKPGEILVLLGASGSGKSSLLRVISGLERPKSGRVTWNGCDMAAVPVYQRPFGLVFQDGQLFANRTVAGNISYGLEAHRLPREQRAARVSELLDLVGLQGLETRDINELSGGQMQRVALARSLAPQPELLLLDEPLSALDRALRGRLAQDLRRIIKKTGTTAVHVTHDREEAFMVADRVAVLARGQLVQIGTPQQLQENPATEEVRALVEV